MNKLLKISLLIVILLPITISAQVTPQQVDEIMNEAMSTFQVAGAAIGIVKDGEVVMTKGYGVQSTATQKPVTERTNFEIASNTKAFTAAALSILAEEGKLDWKDPVIKYIPEFTMYDEYVKQHFTIADLASHHSGMGLGAGDLMWFPDGTDFTIDDLMASFQYQKQTSEFRTKFDYNNQLFIVAGEVVARVSGMSWEDFVTERIFKPLGMNNSYTSIRNITDQKYLAAPHAQKPDGTPYPIANNTHPMNGAAAGIVANVEDLSKWMLLQLNEGRYGKKLKDTLFTEKSQQIMWYLHTVRPGRNERYNTHFSGYGLGWFLSDVKGNMVAQHTGGMPGMLSKTLLIPDMELGIVILTNTSDGGAGLFGSVSNTLMDMYLGMDDYGWIEKYSKYMKSSAEKAEAVVTEVWGKIEKADDSQIAFDNYVGTYKDPWFGDMVVEVKNGKQWLTSKRSPHLNGELFYYQANTYVVKWEFTAMPCDAFIIFSLDENGLAQSMEIKPVSPATDFSFDFQDLHPVRVD